MPFQVPALPTAREDWPADVATMAYLGESGIVLGDLTGDAYGCVWKWGPSNAWGPKPEPREQTGDRAYAHGQWDATRYYGPRVMPVSGSVRVTNTGDKVADHATLHAAEQRFRDAIGVQAFIFRVVEPGWDGYAFVRQQGQVLWTENSHRTASWSISLYAPDPLIWSSQPRDFTLDFPVRVGGAVWPLTWPATWTSTPVSGSAFIDNPGNVDVPMTLVLNGPVTAAAIGLYPATADVNLSLKLNNPDGPLLGSGEYLLIDTARRSVLLNGDAGRRSWASGDFLQVPPGESRIVLSGTGTGNLDGSFRAARI